MEDRNVEEMKREIVRLRHIVEAMGADQADDDRRKRKFTMSDYSYDAHETIMNGIKRPRMISTLQVPTMNGNKAYQVFVRVHDSNDKTLTVQDGYQWRKYGQKVTEDNPSPRAYFRCAMAPTCQVKKKVQRSVEDETILVVSYEGHHNHNKLSSEAELQFLSPSSTLDSNSMIRTHESNNFTNSSSTTNSFTRPSVTLDLTLSSTPKPIHYNTIKEQGTTPSFESNNLVSKFDEEIIKEYVVSLTKDPNFTMALAIAVARSIPDMA